MELQPMLVGDVGGTTIRFGLVSVSGSTHRNWTDEDALEGAIETLRARGFRRAPVVNAHRELMGFVSTDDLIAEVARQLGTLAGLLQRQPERTGRYT